MSRRFLQVSPHLWRGPQPSREELAGLKAGGLRAVFNLRAEVQRSRADALAIGLNYHHLPIANGGVPTPAQVGEFLELLALDGFSPALLHCAEGLGRTGLLVGCYLRSRGSDWVDIARQVSLEPLTPEQARWLYAYIQSSSS